MDEEILNTLCNERLTVQEISDRTGRKMSVVRYWLRKFNLKTNPICYNNKVTDEELLDAYNKAGSIHGIFKILGKNGSGGSFYHYKKRLIRLGMDFSNMNAEMGRKLGALKSARNSNLESLKNREDRARRNSLNTFLKNNNIEEKCGICGITEWLGKKLVLHIHHKDFNKLNNTLDNLIYCCPNCHNTIHYSDKKDNRIYKNRECVCCGALIYNTSKKCCKCHGLERRVPRPNVDDMINEIKQSSFVSVAKKYNVSDNSIRKWLKDEGIDPKTLKKSV